jgi:hypothetical protein
MPQRDDFGVSMRQIRPFDLFLTGAVLFIAGAFFTAAMGGGGGWRRIDLQFGLYSLTGVVYAVWQLRRIHARLNDTSAFGVDRDPRPNDR